MPERATRTRPPPTRTCQGKQGRSTTFSEGLVGRGGGGGWGCLLGVCDMSHTQTKVWIREETKPFRSDSASQLIAESQISGNDTPPLPPRVAITPQKHPAQPSSRVQRGTHPPALNPLNPLNPPQEQKNLIRVCVKCAQLETCQNTGSLEG